MIKNNNDNKIFELKPLLKGDRSDQILNIESNLSIDAYKSVLHIQKVLADSKSSIKTYEYESLGVRDIELGYVYNIDNPQVYDHFPVSIFYSFYKRLDRKFKVDMKVDYIKSPPNLLA
jgi:hypothetical protein